MKNENTVNKEEVVVPIKATRTPSPETILKQEMRSINKELAAVAKTVAEFEAIQNEFDNAEERKAELESDLAAVKAKLRTALGLD